MKEDKLDKEIAASIKKKLAEATVPYQTGSWESFQKKRAAIKHKSIASWVTGIAASLILLGVGLNSVGLFENESTESINIVISSNENTNGEPAETLPIDTAEIRELIANSPLAQEDDLTIPGKDSAAQNQVSKSPNTKSSQNPSGTNALTDNPKAEEMPALANLKPDPLLSPVSDQKPEIPSPDKVEVQVPKLISQADKAEHPVEKERLVGAGAGEEVDVAKQIAEGKIEIAKEENKEVPSKLEQVVAENDIPSIPKDKTSVGLGVGVSPGFGSVQNDNQVAVASSIGLGMLVDIKLPGKLILGSGFGLNYLSQNAEQESTVMAFGNSFPQTEKLEVRQMQVEIPVFVKYPLTRSNSISIQAGFSNFYALNETASQENTVERQLAQYSNDMAGFSSVSLKQQAVTESTSLESSGGRFYPFATLNFGLNFRVLETKGANYIVMPFYNYQVRQVSGYGNTFGLFGASLKLNFGGGEK